MNGETDSLWLIVVVVTGAAGAAMAIYGFRQKAPLPLAFGVAISAVPLLTNIGWIAALISLALVALFIVIRKAY